MASVLSSNWKKLQQTLASKDVNTDGVERASPARPLLKRKALAELHKRPKKQKQITKTSTAVSAHPMGNYASTAAPDKTPPTPAPTNSTPTTTTSSTAQAGKYIAMDCEMVGTTSVTPFSTRSHTVDNEYSILARVSLVSFTGETLYDAYVLPHADAQVTEYRTQWSGITPWHLNPKNTTTKPKRFEFVQKEVAKLLDGRILVGHALKNDLAVLGLSHPRMHIRDTARHAPFRQLAASIGRNGRPGRLKAPSLKKLALEVLGKQIQNDDASGHDSVVDARTAMELFKKEKKSFEEEVTKTFGRSSLVSAAKKKPVFEEVDGSDDADEELRSANDVDDVRTKPSRKRKKKKGKKW